MLEDHPPKVACMQGPLCMRMVQRMETASAPKEYKDLLKLSGDKRPQEEVKTHHLFFKE